MNDAKGRPIEVGDWIATADLHVKGGVAQDGAILGKAIEVTKDLVHIGDGITYKGSEVRTLGGYVWYICLECNAPAPIDMRGGILACPFCGSERMEESATVSHHTASELALEEAEPL